MTEETKSGKEDKKTKRGGRNIIGIVLFTLLVLILLAAIGLAVYVFVFPDDWPKPFHLVFELPAALAAEATPTTDTSPQPGPPVATPSPGAGLMFDTGTKIVNLADPGGRRYLKLSVVLEFTPHDAAFYTLTGEERTAALTAFNDEMSSKKPIVDDLLNTLLSSKTFDQIYTVEGKEALRQDIVVRVNALLPHEHLMYVYFTEFVVQ
jgi:flagellar FliL protein